MFYSDSLKETFEKQNVVSTNYYCIKCHQNKRRLNKNNEHNVFEGQEASIILRLNTYFGP